MTLACAQAAQGAKAQPKSHKPRTIPVSVSLEASEPGPTVPQGFLGLSFEVAALPQIAGYAGHGNLVTLLRSLGPGVLRFGGITADEDIAWAGQAGDPPPWASGALEPANLRGLGSLAAESGWHVLLTLGLGHFEPQAAAEEAAAARGALGESLEAIELGNEPNAYARHGLRALPWTFVQYDEQVAAYRGAIEALAPGIPLAGPDTSGSSAYESWGLGEAIYQRPALLTGHHYPLGCNESPPPSIPRLLSPQIRQLEERSLRRYLFIAQESEVPFLMDETNSVSCGGVPGISDTFASALWALSFLTKSMSMGVAGINFQGNPVNCAGYTPLCAPTGEDAAAGELQPQPEWYALLLARALIGERPLPTRASSPDGADVVASAFLASDGALQVVVIDDDPPGADKAAFALHVGSGFHGASVLSLTAPSPEALTGVRLGGQTVAPDGEWTQPGRLPRAPNKHGVITVDVPPSSAALLTISPVGNGAGGRAARRAGRADRPAR
ncbi:MAG TPA: glycosyl hydrolase family 79 C-terminal domain-containing protein [Solirubrobacteraceae bacterium]|nr:glycosyl hydrolase family 79 C-terminal domain-containing protein [Solirubrobacteraceae bacterium]